MTTPSPHRMSAEERARKACPCYGDGIAGPKECDEVFTCELHFRVVEAITQAESEARAEANEGWQNILPPQFELSRKEAYAKGFSDARERAAKMADVAGNDILGLHPDKKNFRGKIAEAIRALSPASEEKK